MARETPAGRPVAHRHAPLLTFPDPGEPSAGTARLPGTVLTSRTAPWSSILMTLLACSSKPVIKGIDRDAAPADAPAADERSLAPGALIWPEAGELPPPRTEELDCQGAA